MHLSDVRSNLIRADIDISQLTPVGRGLMTEISTEILTLLLEEGTDVLASFMGEAVNENSLAYQSLHYVLTKGIEFILPTVLSASFGDPSGRSVRLQSRTTSLLMADSVLAIVA